MAYDFYVTKLVKNEHGQNIAHVQTLHTRFYVMYECDSDLTESGLKVFVGLIGVSIMVIDEIMIDLTMSSIDKYLKREIAQAIVRELLK